MSTMTIDVRDTGYYTPRRRGDVIYLSTLGGELMKKRVIAFNRRSYTYTVRDCHGWRWVEWLHSRWEVWVKWPLDDRRVG